MSGLPAGKLSLVTGAASGIGREVALAFAREAQQSWGWTRRLASSLATHPTAQAALRELRSLRAKLL
jgi:NAD(P)-dependent dehydrogenase (short-subunit alcohol dehydrogenase family)